MGGDCLNFGCVPSKSLLAAARFADLWRRGPQFGLSYAPPQIDFAAVGDSVERVIAAIAPNDSAERFAGLGVRVLRAEARFTSPRTVRAGEAEIRPRRFVIATGSQPAIPPIPGLDEVPYLTNETIFANRKLPAHLIVIGGGPIGIEMAQAHRRLGRAGHGARYRPAATARRSRTCRPARRAARRARGSRCARGSRSPSVERTAKASVVALEDGERIAGSHLLVAAGRRAEHRSARSRRRRDRRDSQRASPSMRGCARPTAAPSPLATSRAGRNSPISRSITPGS